MSHYRHNINAPQFPPGVHMSHFSLTNTTLVGQEVQQRLWEKYWGQQYPVPPAPFMWPHPGMYYHGYPYGVPNTFQPAPMHGGFGQLHRPLIWQMEEKIDNASDGRLAERWSESYRENDVLVEVLEEGNSWLTNREPKVAKQQSGVYPSRRKIVDPVTDDLNWSMFSGDLADGIVVSILDSFLLELPVLDFAMVQSALEELNKSSPQPKDQLQGQLSVEKEEYFQDIASLTQPTVQKSQGKNSESRETREKDIIDLSLKQTDQSVKKGLLQSNKAGKSTEKILDHLSPLATPSIDEKQGCLQGAASLPESSVFEIEEESNEREKTNDRALRQLDSTISRSDEVKNVKDVAAQTKSYSVELNTIGKTFHEDECNPEAPFTTDSNTTPEEECYSTTTTPQEECHSTTTTPQDECHSTTTTPQEERHSTTKVTSEDKSKAGENETPIKYLLTDEPTETKELANNEKESDATLQARARKARSS